MEYVSDWLVANLDTVMLDINCVLSFKYRPSVIINSVKSMQLVTS